MMNDMSVCLRKQGEGRSLGSCGGIHVSQKYEGVHIYIEDSVGNEAAFRANFILSSMLPDDLRCSSAITVTTGSAHLCDPSKWVTLDQQDSYRCRQSC